MRKIQTHPTVPFDETTTQSSKTSYKKNSFGNIMRFLFIFEFSAKRNKKPLIFVSVSHPTYFIKQFLFLPNMTDKQTFRKMHKNTTTLSKVFLPGEGYIKKKNLKFLNRMLYYAIFSSFKVNNISKSFQSFQKM